MNPTQWLRAGADVLDPALAPFDFHFVPLEAGIGSGGAYATGAYRYLGDDQALAHRVIELFFRYHLGGVRYRAGEHSAEHTYYLAALGVNAEARYPGFSDDPLDGFRDLRADLERFGADFLTGDAAAVVVGAEQEAAERQLRTLHDNAAAAGDALERAKARDAFYSGEYAKAKRRLESVRYPELLTKVDRRILELARRRSMSE